MGLLRGMARTAVVAGTATAVSNRVSRRQQARAAAPGRGAAPNGGSAVERDAADDQLAAEIDRLARMHERGTLTDEEFAAAKAKLLRI
jgi:hypothetical protein